MKNWRKKLKNVFSSKGNNKSPRIMETSSFIMMEKRREPMTSHHRSLPTIPNVHKAKIIQNAEDWVVKNKAAVERKLRLIERHPELKSGKELTGKKSDINIGSRVSHCRNGTYKNVNTSRQESQESDQTVESNKCHWHQTDADDSGVSVPDILVSHAEDDDILPVENEPLSLFVCGYVDNDLWHRLLVDLCKHYSIRCTSASDYPECNRWLPGTDVFLFLMDETSMNEYPYRDQLRLAVELNLRIVYVRDLGFELKVQKSFRNFQSDKIHSPKRARSSAETVSTRELLHPNIPIQRLQSLALNSTIIGIETDEEASSRDLYCAVSPPPFRRTKSDLHQSSNSVYHLRHSEPDVDVTKLTEKEYGTALVYHNLYHRRCLDRITSAINSNAPSFVDDPGYTNSRHSLLTPVSTYSLHSGISGDSAVGDMYQTISPEPINLDAKHEIGPEDEPSFDDIPTASRKLSSPMETIFIVSPASGDEKPKIFHWPQDVEKEVVSNSPSIDSLGFQDIDLSKRINEIDVFESYQSD